MATDPAFADHVLDQVGGAGRVAIRKMFGEYGIYCDGKVVALVCDNQVFLKPLPEAAALIGTPAYGPPYPGAKPHLVLSVELDDPDLMARLVRAVAEALPAPKPRKPKVDRRASPAADQVGRRP